MKRGETMTSGAAARWQRARYNPWRNVTPQILAAALDEYEAGWLRRAALMWENRVRRDDSLAGAVPKRTASVARLPWEIVKVDDSARAAAHAEKLEALFNNVEAADAIDLDRRGGLREVIKRMASAVFTGWSVHELVWSPGPGDLRVRAIHVPLYFFERTTGQLRYTGPELSTTGAPLDPGGWMVTAAEPLLPACLVACLFKSLSLSDWVSFSERFGMPGIHGEIDAAPDSPEWTKFGEALEAFANEWVCQTRSGAKINLIEAGRTGDAPFAPMVERMSRSLVMLCRGADLGTISSKDGAGASLQGDESDLLLEDDAQLISETLQSAIARPAIRHLFGEEPLAYIELQVPADEDTAAEIAVDTFLLDRGVPITAEDLAERYGRQIAAPEPDPTAEPDPEPSAAPLENAAPADDSDLLAASAALIRQVADQTLRRRLYDELRAILLRAGDDDLPAAIDDLRRRTADWLDDTAAAEAAWADFTAAALFSGWSGGPDAPETPANAMQTHANAPQGPGRGIEPSRGERPSEWPSAPKIAQPVAP